MSPVLLLRYCYLMQVMWYLCSFSQPDVNQLLKAVSVGALGSGHRHSKVLASFASTRRLEPSTTQRELLKQADNVRLSGLRSA